jgi:hypothetical protein
MDNGLIAPEAYANPQTPYYIDDAAGTVIDEPTLVSTIALRSADSTSTGFLTVGGAAAGLYQGAVSIQAGDNGVAPGNQVCLTGRGAATGCIVEVGDNAQASNLLLIAGALGTAQVYDEKYNQPVSLQPITKQQTEPAIAPANPEEVLRCGQAGIAAAIATPGSQANFFQVPRTGAYMVQTEIAVGNAGVPNTVVIPSTLVAGVPIWESISLSFRIQAGASVPYASFEVLGGDYYGDQAFASNSFITKTFTSVAILTAGVQYVVTLNAGAGWNIGDGGQIKCELVAMC